MQDHIPYALIAAFERQYDASWNDPQLRNERLAMRYGWAAAMEAKQCLQQIQEPAPATAMDALREAEAALEVAMARILKADPGHSICVTSEAKALVAVRAALAATAPVDALATGGQAQADKEMQLAMQEASSLAQSIFMRHYSDDEHYASGSVVWGLCDSLRGVISQIGNMTSGLVRAPQAQTGARDADDGMYYLQDARWSAMVGKCPSWWRPDGNGYTTNLDEAARFTFAEAMAQHRCRDTDLPWLCSEVEKLRRPTVDCQYMPRSWDAQRAAIAAQSAAKEGSQR